MSEQKTKTNDGGPAFPGEQGHNPDGTWNQAWEPGMTLLEYLAAHAPPVPKGWRISREAERSRWGHASVSTGDAATSAAWSIAYAKEVLRQLEADK